MKGKIRFFEAGRITPFPESIIPGGTDVKSICFRNEEVSFTPLLFLTEDSTFRSVFPCSLFVGSTLMIFELMLIVASEEGVKWISPSVS